MTTTTAVKHRSILGPIIVAAFLALVLYTFGSPFFHQALRWFEELLPKQVVERVREVRVNVAPTPAPVWMSRDALKNLIYERVPAATNIDPRIFFVLASKESGNAWNTARERFEPRQFDKFKRLFQEWMTQREKERFATSYGLFQILYGYHKDRCKLREPVELFDPAVNLDCAIRVWGDAWHEARRLHKGDVDATVWEAFRIYNGGGHDAEVYATEALKKYHAMLVADAMNQAMG